MLLLLNRLPTITALILATRIFLFEANATDLIIDNGLLRVKVDSDHGGFSIETIQPQRSFAVSGIVNGATGSARVVPVFDKVFGTGQGIEITGTNGATGRILVFPKMPFALIRAGLKNPGTAVDVINRVKTAIFKVDLGKTPDELKVMGTGGLLTPDKCPGSYAWVAVADPQNRNGVVAGWLTHERASGVLFPKVTDGMLTLEARSDYGRLLLASGQSAEGEALAVGYFADARLGLEAWADTVAKVNSIELPPPPAGFCTWYSDRFGGSGNEKGLAELADFATQNLVPFGFNFAQIDDGWQMGDSKANGPRKNFTQSRPGGPYPAGMKATADRLKAAGLKPGLWFMPFAGTWNDPWFAEHQDWFVKDANGKPYDNPWGGSSLDLTRPAVREYLRNMVAQMSKDWDYSYFKMDGLYTGLAARPGYVNSGYREDNFGDAVFFDPAKTNVEVYRGGMKIIREATLPGTFLLGCTTAQNMRTYQTSFGLVDAMRTGPDNAADWLAWVKNSPVFGTRHYFLNGRIWYNDADPYYIRASLPLDEARSMASWSTISGQLATISDWIPALPPDRIEILKRCLPVHRSTARPVDYLEQDRPSIWSVTDERNGVRRDVLALFNWEDHEATIETLLSRLGLPEASEYVAFDFWENIFLSPFKRVLNSTLPQHSCRILAIHPLVNYPFLLSTSRHLTQGMIEVSREKWNSADEVLSGESAVVGGDPYELRIYIPSGTLTISKARFELTGQRKGAVEVVVDQAGSELRAKITSPTSQEISWQVSLKAGN